MEIFLQFLKVFAVGGAICLIAQLLINYTKITSGKILVIFLMAGLLLQAFGVYQYLVDFAGAAQDLEQLSPCAIATKSCAPRAHALQQEKPLQ